MFGWKKKEKPPVETEKIVVHKPQPVHKPKAVEKTAVDIFNDNNLSEFAKAQELHRLWYDNQDKWAKHYFEMLRGSENLKKGWLNEREKNSRDWQAGIHYVFKESYHDFMSIMSQDFVK